MQFTQQLHDASHRCDAGIVCSFQPSFHGRWKERNVTFAWGRAGYASLVMVADGHLSEEQFRDLGLYEVCKLGSSTRPTNRRTIYTLTQHGTASSGDVAGAAPEALPVLHVQR
jgi:hypothetical protein